MAPDQRRAAEVGRNLHFHKGRHPPAIEEADVNQEAPCDGRERKSELAFINQNPARCNRVRPNRHRRAKKKEKEKAFRPHPGKPWPSIPPCLLCPYAPRNSYTGNAHTLKKKIRRERFPTPEGNRKNADVTQKCVYLKNEG